MLRRYLHTSFQMFLLFSGFIIYKCRLISPPRYGRKLARRIEKLGGIYVKIGQLLSVRPDIISFAVADELRPLLQNLKPVPFEKIRKVIEGSGDPFLKEYLLFTDPVPLGTGSVAQVHRITPPDSGALIVKIMKPGLRRHAGADLKMFRFIMKMGSYMPGLNKLPVRELGNEIETVIRQQLDLKTEGEMLEKFRKNFAENPDVIIPSLNTAVISPDFILTDYITLPPEPVYEDWPAAKRSAVAKKALLMLYQMMFRDGLTHCDMHPGNFFITPEGKFILIDFGMVARMDGEARNDYIRFFFNMATNNGKGCAEVIEKTALHKSKRFSRQKLDTEVINFINDFNSLSASEFSVVAFTKRLIQVERKCGIKGSTSFINNILAIVFFESHLKRVDPDIDFQEEAAEYIIRKVPNLIDIFGSV